MQARSVALASAPPPLVPLESQRKKRKAPTAKITTVDGSKAQWAYFAGSRGKQTN